MQKAWNDFFDKGGSSSYDDYYLKPKYLLKTGNKRDGYVLKLAKGINWRFTAEFPEAEIAKAQAMANQEFIDMDVKQCDRNTDSNIANIRILKKEDTPLTDSELYDLLLRIATLTIGWRNA